MVLERFRLDGRVALVTGGSSGIGLAIAEALHEAGASVVLAARREAVLAEAVARLGSRAAGCAGDGRGSAGSRPLAERAAPASGRPKSSVHAAGLNARQPWEAVEGGRMDRPDRGRCWPRLSSCRAISRRRCGSAAWGRVPEHRLACRRCGDAGQHSLWRGEGRVPCTHPGDGRGLGGFGITCNAIAPAISPRR
jgi:hypothetical protein